MPASPDHYYSSAPLLSACAATLSDPADELSGVDACVVEGPRSTGVDDCRLLYLLVRAFNPRRLLELGTYVGSTCNAMALACAANDNGATITTLDTDTSGYHVPDRFASFVDVRQGHSDTVLDQLEPGIDFIFADGSVSPRTVRQFNALATPATIFVTHDFTYENERNMDKGVMAHVLMAERFRHQLAWFLPAPKTREEKWKPVALACGTTLNACCAFGIPRSRLKALGADIDVAHQELPALADVPPERVHTYKQHGYTVRWVELDDGRMAFWGHERGLMRRLFG